jgi:hypothetical protein
MFRLDRLDRAWMLLLGLALATLVASSVVPLAWLGNAVVLSLAALKGRKIALDYLGLRTAPALWRGLVLTWVGVVTVFATAAAAVHVLI